MRLAVLSDIHGNLSALEAVLADIARAGADAVLHLGDAVSGPLDPAGTAERVMASGWPSVSGNHDRWVARDDEATLSPVDRFARAALSPAQRDWLAGLPATAVFAGEVFLCHGTPRSDTEVWLDNYFAGRSTELPDLETVTRRAEGLDYPLLLCGHTHMARSVRLRDGRLIVNPGAVGLQFVHGSPDARYALVERRDGRWHTTLRVVPYDSEAAAALAARNGFSHWCGVLRHGWDGPEGLF